MTNAELKTLRERLGLSVDWLAGQVGVAPRTVQYWEGGRTGFNVRVPEDVAELLRSIDAIFDQCVKNALNTISAVEKKQGVSPSDILLVRYKHEDDLYDAHPEFAELNLPVTAHGAMIGRVAKILYDREIPVTINFFRNETENA